MRITRRMYPLAAVLPAGAFLALALAGGPAQASNLSHRPGAGAATASVSARTTSTPGFNSFANTFSTGIGNFCDNSADAPCDGNAGAGHYGAVDQVNSKFNNYGYGNYAGTRLPRIPTATGTLANHVVLSGTTSANQGLGCQTPGTEGCTGPYVEQTAAHRPQYGFPSNGYTVTVYQWIDPAYASSQNDVQIDTDLGINQVNGTTASYGQDEVISACNDSGGTSMSFGHGSPGACGSGDQITSAGWYRFVFLVNDIGGNVFLDARVLNEAGTVKVFDSGPQVVSFDGGATQATTDDTGGLRYLWWPTLNVQGLPVGYIGYFSGQQRSGHAA